MKLKDILKEEVRYDREMMEEYTDQLAKSVMAQLDGSIVNHFNLERDLTPQEILNLKKN